MKKFIILLSLVFTLISCSLTGKENLEQNSVISNENTNNFPKIDGSTATLPLCLNHIHPRYNFKANILFSIGSHLGGVFVNLQPHSLHLYLCLPFINSLLNIITFSTFLTA
ncbi:MAG: hypothetical protein LBU14_04875 [Candidatus Peribacteria bacterium]|jgi:hypothetical protein|nr:hypothetical protein [Candidatus Peribacteria bacterium]